MIQSATLEKFYTHKKVFSDLFQKFKFLTRIFLKKDVFFGIPNLEIIILSQRD